MFSLVAITTQINSPEPLLSLVSGVMCRSVGRTIGAFGPWQNLAAACVLEKRIDRQLAALPSFSSAESDRPALLRRLDWNVQDRPAAGAAPAGTIRNSSVWGKTAHWQNKRGRFDAFCRTSDEIRAARPRRSTSTRICLPNGHGYLRGWKSPRPGYCAERQTAPSGHA